MPACDSDTRRVSESQAGGPIQLRWKGMLRAVMGSAGSMIGEMEQCRAVLEEFGSILELFGAFLEVFRAVLEQFRSFLN